MTALTDLAAALQRVEDGFYATTGSADESMAIVLNLARQGLDALAQGESVAWGWAWTDGSEHGVLTVRQDYEHHRRTYPRMTFTTLYTHPALPALSAEEREALAPDVIEDDGSTAYDQDCWNEGWNACREEMIRRLTHPGAKS